MCKSSKETKAGDTVSFLGCSQSCKTHHYPVKSFRVHMLYMCRRRGLAHTSYAPGSLQVQIDICRKPCMRTSEYGWTLYAWLGFRFLQQS